MIARSERRAGGPQGLRREWTLAFVGGELVGFIPPAIVGTTMASAEVSDLFLVVGLTAAGMLEGAAIGVFQARVLRRHAPRIDRGAWVVATTLAAGFAWFVGMGGGALMSTDIAPRVLLALVLGPAWCVALLGMGYAQWVVMRRTLDNAQRWIWVTAGAWLIGVSIPTVALSAAPNGWPGWAFAIVGVLAAVMMGLTVGAITARTFGQLLSASSRVGGPPPHARLTQRTA